MVNKVIIVGVLGHDPEIKSTQSRIPVTTFSVATTEKWRDKTSGETNEQTEWHRVTTFRRLAEICGEYLQKGSKVYIEGKLQTRSWEKDGVKRYSTEIVAHEMKMLDSKTNIIKSRTEKDFGEVYTSSDESSIIRDAEVPFHYNPDSDPPF